VLFSQVGKIKILPWHYICSQTRSRDQLTIKDLQVHILQSDRNLQINSTIGIWCVESSSRDAENNTFSLLGFHLGRDITSRVCSAMHK
jgi:hypothetical protein